MAPAQGQSLDPSRDEQSAKDSLTHGNKFIITVDELEIREMSRDIHKDSICLEVACGGVVLRSTVKSPEDRLLWNQEFFFNLTMPSPNGASTSRSATCPASAVIISVWLVSGTRKPVKLQAFKGEATWGVRDLAIGEQRHSWNRLKARGAGDRNIAGDIRARISLDFHQMKLSTRWMQPFQQHSAAEDTQPAQISVSGGKMTLDSSEEVPEKADDIVPKYPESSSADGHTDHDRNVLKSLKEENEALKIELQQMRAKVHSVSESDDRPKEAEDGEAAAALKKLKILKQAYVKLKLEHEELKQSLHANHESRTSDTQGTDRPLEHSSQVQSSRADSPNHLRERQDSENTKMISRWPSASEIVRRDRQFLREQVQQLLEEKKAWTEERKKLVEKMVEFKSKIVELEGRSLSTKRT